MSPQWHFTTWLDLLDHWQSLAAGLVAVAAAIIAVGGAEVFARLKERRERKAILLSLAAEVRTHLDLYIMKRGIIRPLSEREVSGRDLKIMAELPSPIVFSASADRIGLLGARIAAGLTEFYAAQESLNMMVRLAATDPDKVIHRGSIEDLAVMLGRACIRALPLLAELPHKKADAALKKTIESFAQTEAPASAASPGP
jgi:hypothetical protein